ncbi:MAG: hypothetical protein VKP63_01020 [Cyanobacteriota bacterium]|nr:hypothetical protein [Cyanobacteriota bacterium]
MPIRFARDLAYGQKPREVPPPGGGLTSGAMVSPAANEMPALAQVVGDNLHLQGTPMRPGFSAQVEPLSRAIDPMDLEAARGVGAPDIAGPMATRTTLAVERPEQAVMRMEQMDTNRSGQQMQTEMLSASGLVTAVTAPQQAQKVMEQQRLMNQQMAQAGGTDMTGAMTYAQEFSIQERLKRMDPKALETIDNFRARMMRPGSTFAIGA